MHADKTITQTIFMVLFTSGSFPHLGIPLDALSGISSRYSSATSFPLNILSHYRYNPMGDFQFFSKDPSQWGKDYTDLWGHLDICPSLGQLHLVSLTFPELSSLISLRAWGEVGKPHSNMAYLLVSAKDEANVRQSVMATPLCGWIHHRPGFPLWRKWVRQLTALVSSGPNWPYTLVQLNEDTCHVPLPREGHLGILTEGDTNSTV